MTTENHRCAGCQNKPRDFEVTSVRPIYFGVVVERECPDGHRVIEHRRS